MSIKIKFTRLSVATVAVLAFAAIGSGTALAANRNVLIVNETNHTLTNLYASRSRDHYYHGDWLGDDVLLPGQSTIIDFDDDTGACVFDIMGKFNDDTTAQKHYYNVCANYRLNFTGD